MKKCPKCDSEVSAKDKFCSSCGANLKKKSKKKESSTSNADEIFNKIGDNLERILDTEDTSKDYTNKDIESNKGMAILSYIGPLALIPYFTAKDSKYASYHAKQGMNLLIVWIVYTIMAAILYSIKFTYKCEHSPVFGVVTSCVKKTPWWIKLPVDLIGLFFFAISVIGIVYALTGKAKKLPLIDKVNIIK